MTKEITLMGLEIREAFEQISVSTYQTRSIEGLQIE